MVYLLCFVYYHRF